MTAAVARRTRPTAHGGRGSSLSMRPSSRPMTQVVRPQSLRPRLRVYSQDQIRRRARRRNLVIGLFVVLLMGFFAVALVQAQLVAGQRDLDLLRSRIAEAQAERARLERAVDESSAPSAIIARAEELGMVRSTDPVYLAAVAPAPTVTPISLARPAVLVDEGESILASAVGFTAQFEQPVTVPVMTSIAGSRAVVAGTGTG